MELEAYGIDLSAEAIKKAYEWYEKTSKDNLKQRLTIGVVTKMPYQEETFDFVVSHGVLDSMYFEIAKQAIREVKELLKKVH